MSTVCVYINEILIIYFKLNKVVKNQKVPSAPKEIDGRTSRKAKKAATVSSSHSRFNFSFPSRKRKSDAASSGERNKSRTKKKKGEDKRGNDHLMIRVFLTNCLLYPRNSPYCQTDNDQMGMLTTEEKDRF